MGAFILEAANTLPLSALEFSLKACFQWHISIMFRRCRISVETEYLPCSRWRFLQISPFVRADSNFSIMFWSTTAHVRVTLQKKIICLTRIIATSLSFLRLPRREIAQWVDKRRELSLFNKVPLCMYHYLHSSFRRGTSLPYSARLISLATLRLKRTHNEGGTTEGARMDVCC